MGHHQRQHEGLVNHHARDEAEGSGPTSSGGDAGLPPTQSPKSTPPVTRDGARIFPYFTTLPYPVEDEALPQQNLAEILKHLYIAIQADDFTFGAIRWTGELRSWLDLKFDPTKEQRVRLVQLYYELSLAPGLDVAVADRFANMFALLTTRRGRLRPFEDLTLDWRLVHREWKVCVLPDALGVIQRPDSRRVKTLVTICSFAQPYFPPEASLAMLEELLPRFTLSQAEDAFVVVGLINLLFPTTPSPTHRAGWGGPQFLPTLFHLWSLVSRSRTVDGAWMDLLSRMAQDALPNEHVQFSEFGIFTPVQSTLTATAILRLLEIPVGQSTSPYSGQVDRMAGRGLHLTRDSRSESVPRHIARWFVMSLSPACLKGKESMLSLLETLIQAVETLFHPSNAGSWTRSLASLVCHLADFFVMRWNRERSGEMEMPAPRRLNAALRQRFVRCLRGVTFMGIYAKDSSAVTSALSALRALAFLEPDLVLPGALQRIYPSMQGLVAVHRTCSSLRTLQTLARTMIRTKGYRCHVTTLLGLTLAGIDANDLEKTHHALAFLANVCYDIPLEDLSRGRHDVRGSVLAREWIAREVEGMEQWGTAPELISFFGQVFTLLQNMPAAARSRSGSPEENVVHDLAATVMPLLASLSPELFDLALGKVVDFVTNDVVHQSRDAAGLICKCVCQVDPEKALARLVPVLVAAIRTEIDENDAGSTRNVASEVLLRDRGLVWGITMLSMCVVGAGSAVLKYKRELLDIAMYTRQKCKGTSAVHTSGYVHHLLLNLTTTRTADYRQYEPARRADGIGARLWGWSEPAATIKPRWHVPSHDELDFAVELFRSQAEAALTHLGRLIEGSPSIARHRGGKEWSDEVSGDLVLLRQILAGGSALFDARDVNRGLSTAAACIDAETAMSQADGSRPANGQDAADRDALLGEAYETPLTPSFRYPCGELVGRGDEISAPLHQLRQQIGRVLHQVHEFLTRAADDEVASFAPLYTAYQSWFLDVGMERSAGVLGRDSRRLRADQRPYKVKGMKRDYPRALLVRRADVYHTRRLRHNAMPRLRSELDEQLLQDLAESAVSPYSGVRRKARSALDSALKVVSGGSGSVIPPLLTAFREAVERHDFPRIKGAFFALLSEGLAETVRRHGNYACAVIRAFIDASAADDPSTRALCKTQLSRVREYGYPGERMAIIDRSVADRLAPEEDVADSIARRKSFVLGQRARAEQRKAELAEELSDLGGKTHWKMATRVALLAMSLGMRFDHVASNKLIGLITRGTIDPHPRVRHLYSQGFVLLCNTIDNRAMRGHDYANHVQALYACPALVKVTTRSGESTWTGDYLKTFSQPKTDVYLDHDHPGWLVWSPAMPGREANGERDLEYDQLEMEKRSVIGRMLDRDWLSTCFRQLKQEPDPSADHFRQASVELLAHAFSFILREGLGAATFDEVKEETLTVFGNGSDKHQHRATAEILAALVTSVMGDATERRTMVWDFALPIIRTVFSEGLTPANLRYWTTFVRVVLHRRDPRRAWPLVEMLSAFRLDMCSNATFADSSKLDLLRYAISTVGWRFQLVTPIAEDLLGHIDHPYECVRLAIARTLAAITLTRYHESCRDVAHLLEAQQSAGPVGQRPYVPTRQFHEMITEVFSRLERWRLERPPDRAGPSRYTSGARTVLVWLRVVLASSACTQLVTYFPHPFTEQVLHMMDAKEDSELQSLACRTFQHLPDIPHPVDEDSDLIESLIRIGKTSPSWHHRLRVVVPMRVIFFRRLFLMSDDSKRLLVQCLADMLEDTQHEVRAGAATALSGIISCSPPGFRETTIRQLRDRFTETLIHHPPLKPPKGQRGGVATGCPSTRTSPRTSGTSHPAPAAARSAIARHAAVLGLGALVEAFPYSSPPPAWMRDVLVTLSSQAANDPASVGSCVKSIISRFKHSRQDSWDVDVRVFNTEQMEDLFGGLWRSYFA